MLGSGDNQLFWQMGSSQSPYERNNACCLADEVHPQKF